MDNKNVSPISGNNPVRSSKTKLWVIIGIVAFVAIIGTGAFVLFLDKEPSTDEFFEANDEFFEAEDNEVFISLQVGDFFFNPDEIIVQQGALVELFIENQGAHTFTIDELGIDVPLNESFETIDFFAREKGEFVFYCRVHGKEVMRGVLKVV